jgi:anti-anti-sigma regulatory factor
VACVIFLGAAYLGRIGRVTIGSYLVIGITSLAILASIYTERSTPSTPFYLLLPILLAGVLLPAVQIWSVLVICLVGTALVFGLLPPELRDNPMWAQTMRGVPLVLIMTSLIMFISSRSTSVALEEARAARADAEAASAGLAESNASLEGRVTARTTELSRALEEQQLIAHRLEESLAAQSDMNRLIGELSVPIIPITKDALIVPLVGAIDSARAGQLLDDLLGMIERSHARLIILDVTGVAIVDTQVAASLLRISAAARLMGAETVLVGIRPEVAQTLVGLGVDLDSIHTAASLQDGLAFIQRVPR